MSAESFHRFLIQSAKIPDFPLVRQFDWPKLVGHVVIALAVGTVLKLAWPTVRKVIHNKDSWAAACLVYESLIQLTLGHDTDVYLGTHVHRYTT